MQISLYFHIPFCTKKCPYCHFYVIPSRDLHKEIYLKALKREWQMKLPLIRDKELLSVYFGGGTPSIFPEAACEVLSWIEQEKLTLSKEFECTFEVNPEDIGLSLIQKLKDKGVNRISMGVQSLWDDSLFQIGRSHDAKTSIKGLQIIAKAGIKNVSIDLMYDLPKQTFRSFQNTLKRIKDLPITHLSLYNLTLEPHTVFFKKRKELSSLLPNPNESLKMLNFAIQSLQEYGFHRYEISAFAKDNYYSRHNTGYWLARPFLGYGPSAFSYWERKRFRNVSHLLKYARLLEEKKDPVDFSEELPLEESQKELLCIRLRLLERVPLFSFQKEHGKLFDSLLQNLEKLNYEGFLFQKDGFIALSEKGVLFHDTVAETLLT